MDFLSGAAWEDWGFLCISSSLAVPCGKDLSCLQGHSAGPLPECPQPLGCGREVVVAGDTARAVVALHRGWYQPAPHQA